MRMKSRNIKFSSVVIRIIFSILILIRVMGMKKILLKLPAGSLLQFVPQILYNIAIIGIPLILGSVYYRDKFTVKTSILESFKIWGLSVITLVIIYGVYFLEYPKKFKMWDMWGIFFPVLSSTAVSFSGIVFSLLLGTYIYRFQKQHTNKQNLFVLCVLTIFSFVTSAGTYSLSYAIYGLYLILYFAWGMFLAQVNISKRSSVLLFILNIFSWLVILLGVSGFNGIYWTHKFNGDSINWNYQFLSNITSPLMSIIVITGYLLLKKSFDKVKIFDIEYLIPIIIFSEVSINKKLISTVKLVPSIVLNKLIIFVGLVLISYCIYLIYSKFFSRFKLTKSLEKALSSKAGLIDNLMYIFSKLCNKIFKYRITLLTIVWFYLISFTTFLIVTNGLRIRVSTTSSVNAIIYLLGYKFFAIILTELFLLALFYILYFVTSRYWFSSILVSVIAIGWAYANKIKLDLRGEPIYPSELREISNIKTLVPMIGQNRIIQIIFVLIILLILCIFLEKKIPVKRENSRKFYGLMALSGIALLFTPNWFNHEGNAIYYINRGFDNIQVFNNPERDIQMNGPILSFLDYIDLQVIDKPSKYSQAYIKSLNKKYKNIASKINKTRKNYLKNQTVIFNLSESFVDPYTFPTIKISSSVSNPVEYIRTLKNVSTYGKMLSAGYGGGTANMEYEALTGFNMGIFKSTLTPYVQIVPKYQYYPTIGANFSYASTIHPFIGTYYSRVEDYKRFKFNKFVYLGSKYKIIKQKKLGSSTYNSDYTAYANGLKQINQRRNGQLINLITIQNHMPYNNWYSKNEYVGKISGKLFNDSNVNSEMATYIKGIQYTDKAVKKFISKLDKINKPITLVFYGDHYPSILSQSYIDRYPIQMHSTTYFIYSNKYARKHGAKTKLKKNTAYVNTSDFIAMMLEQTNSKVTPYQALLTEIHKELPAVTINFNGNKGLELVNQKGKEVKIDSLSKKQRNLLKDYETIQYDMTAGKGYSLKTKGFYKN